MWYHDQVTGQLISGNYTASINEQWLTSMVPAPSRRCLAAIASADMAGTPANDTEVWGGPLSNGSFVLALQNRCAPNGTMIRAPVSVLFEPNGFFSFAMTAPVAARALGFAKHVSPPLTLSQLTTATDEGAEAAPALYSVRDVTAGKTLPSPVQPATGAVSALVDNGDTKLFVLSPVDP